jgi:hypothetical protein
MGQVLETVDQVAAAGQYLASWGQEVLELAIKATTAGQWPSMARIIRLHTFMAVAVVQVKLAIPRAVHTVGTVWLQVLQGLAFTEPVVGLELLTILVVKEDLVAAV